LNRPQACPWAIREVAFAFLAGFILSALPALFAFGESHLPLAGELLACVLQSAGFISVPLLLVCGVYRQPISTLGFRRPAPREFFLVACLGGGFLYLLNLMLSTLMLWILPEAWVQEQSVVLLLEMADAPVERVLIVLFILLLAPFSEELLFRAFLYPALCRQMSEKRAVFCGAAVFAALHLNLFAFVPLFAGGIGFNWIYARYRNLWYNVAVHMMWNALSLLLYFLA